MVHGIVPRGTFGTYQLYNFVFARPDKCRGSVKGSWFLVLVLKIMLSYAVILAAWANKLGKCSALSPEVAKL